MKHLHRLLRTAVCLAILATPVITTEADAQVQDPRSYDIGEPADLVDLYVSAAGNDGNPGTSREQPLATLGAAWGMIGELQQKGYRINILPGIMPCEGANCTNLLGDRAGIYEHPIIIRAADGPGTVTILGGLNVSHVSYLYLIDLNLTAGGGSPHGTENVLRIGSSDHILLRGLTLTGPDPALPEGNYDIRDVLKADRSSYLYIEDCDISGAYETGVDLFSVQYGHMITSTIHKAAEWGMEVKGGSAYLRVEGNTITDTRLGFQAGGESNFRTMQAPWIHYEAYDIRFMNNILHDISGVPLGVAGGFNVLFAYNTLYRVAYDQQESHALLHLVHGGRRCVETPESGGESCTDLLAEGGWGPTSTETGGAWIPNRNVYVFNNIFFNPEPFQTQVGQIGANTWVVPPEGSNVESPSSTDVNVRIRGNMIWNGPQSQLLTVTSTDGGEPGCDKLNVFCNEAQLLEENTINTMRPELIDPDKGDFRPVPGGNVEKTLVYEISDFTWAEAPASPSAPTGALSNGLSVDVRGTARPARDLPGAHTLASPQAEAPAVPIQLAPFDTEPGVTITPTIQWSAVQGAGTYRMQASTTPDFTTLVADRIGLSATAVPVEDLNTGTTYYWHVRARNGVGNSPWSPAWSFTTLGSVMTAPTLISPADGTDDADSIVTLTWDSPEGAQTYVLQVAADSGFAAPLLRKGEIASTTEEFLPVPGAVYYWRVRALNGLGVSDWSQVWSFSSPVPETPTVGVDEVAANLSYQMSIYPNPSSGVVTVAFALPESGPARLTLLNGLGESVAVPVDGNLEEGRHDIRIEPGSLPSGLYTCRLEHDGRFTTRTVLLLR